MNRTCVVVPVANPAPQDFLVVLVYLMETDRSQHTYGQTSTSLVYQTELLLSDIVLQGLCLILLDFSVLTE